MVFFGQLVLGPPGAGKTTYCQGMQMFLRQLGRRCEIINLDFANDILPYQAIIDVRELVSLERVMEEFDLGPNGGIIHCMEYLVTHLDWLEEKIGNLEPTYILFDLPGQVELFTHYTHLETILHALQKNVDCRLCSVHLLDSFYCCEPATFISAVLLIASTMLRMALPHVNVLTKIDLLPLYGQLPFNLDFFTENLDLSRLIQFIDTDAVAPCTVADTVAGTVAPLEEGEPPAREFSKYEASKASRRRMTEGLCDVLNDFGLVSFLPLNISDVATLPRVVAAIDTANGYSFAASEAQYLAEKKVTPEEVQLNAMFRYAASDLESVYSRSIEVYERYTPGNAGGEGDRVSS